MAALSDLILTLDHAVREEKQPLPPPQPPQGPVPGAAAVPGGAFPALGGSWPTSPATALVATAWPGPVATHTTFGLALFTSVVCASLRSVRYAIVKRKALDLLLAVARHVDDELR